MYPSPDDPFSIGILILSKAAGLCNVEREIFCHKKKENRKWTKVAGKMVQFYTPGHENI